MCKSIEKIFKFQIFITQINKSSPHFRRNMDLFIFHTPTSGVEAT